MDIKCVGHGWPDYLKNVLPEIHDLFAVCAELSVVRELRVREQQIVIPEAMTVEILGKLHEGHHGVTNCKASAATSVWWPGMHKDIEETGVICSYCLTQRPNQRKEPMMPTPLPDRSWQRAGADVCELEGRCFLIVVDYYPRYFDFTHLSSMTSSQVIGKLKNSLLGGGSLKKLSRIIALNSAQTSFAYFCHKLRIHPYVKQPTPSSVKRGSREGSADCQANSATG